MNVNCTTVAFMLGVIVGVNSDIELDDIEFYEED